MSWWKRVIAILAALMLLACGGLVAFTTWIWTGATRDTVGKVDFVNQLAIPPLAPSTVDDAGRRVFDLTAQAGRHDFGSGRSAGTWGFNGSYLGPTVRAKRGEQVVMNVRNSLDAATTVHWHGMRLPAAMDGSPHQLVPAGESWSPTWQVDQPAATLWYHPHPHEATADHVYRGLAGMFIVDDDRALPLPVAYGVDDVPVIVQDKDFDDDELEPPGTFPSDIGGLGEDVVVNGTYAPYLEVGAELTRLRLLNASNGRSYRFGFADNRAFDLIATDGGLLDRPHRMEAIQLSAGERAEIIVRMRPGERVVLRSERPDLAGGAIADRFNGGDDRFDVLQLRAAATLRPSAALPEVFGPVDLPETEKVVQTRDFALSSNKINKAEMDLGRLDAVVTRGTTEIWEVRNSDGSPHNFHIHGVEFRVLPSADGGAVPPELSGRKDTIFVRPNTTMRLAIRFDGPSDANVPYMFHCHLLRHEDRGMMGQFVVVEPGQQAGTPPAHQHSAGQ